MTTHPAITRLRELSEKATREGCLNKEQLSKLNRNTVTHFENNIVLAQTAGVLITNYPLVRVSMAEALPVLLDCLEMALDILGAVKRETISPEESKEALKLLKAKLDTLKGGSDESR